MTQNKDIRTRVGYSVDQASVAAVTAANSQVSVSFKGVALDVKTMSAEMLALNPQLGQLAAVETSTAAATKTLADTQILAANATVQQKAGIQDLTALYAGLEKQELAAAAAATTAASAGAGGGGIGRGISNASRALFNLPDVQLAPGLSTTVVSRLGLVAGVAAEGLGLTAAALGSIGIAAGVAVLAIKSITDAEAARAEAARKGAENLLTIAQKVSGGETSQDIRGQISEQERLRSSLLEGQETLRGFQERIGAQVHAYETGISSTDEFTTNLRNINAELYDATGGALGFKDGLGTAVGSVGEFNGVLGDNQTQIDGTTQLLTILNLVLNSTGVAANDAAAELQKQTEAQLKQVDRELDFSRMTQEERAKRVAQDQQEIAFLQMQIYNTDLTADASEQLSIRIGELKKEIVDLNPGVKNLTDFFNEAEKAAAKFQDEFEEAWDNLGDAQRRAGEAAEKVREAEEDLTEARREYEDKMTEIEIEGLEKRHKIIKDAAKDAEEALDKHNKRVAEIELQYARDAEAAVGNRDALALYKAQQKHTDDLTKEGENYAEQQKKLKEHLDEQLAAHERALQKAFDNEMDSYRKRERQLLKALSDAQAEEWKAQQLALGYQKRANELQLAEQQRLYGNMQSAQNSANVIAANAQITHQQTVAQIVSSGAVAVENAFQTMMNNLVAIVNGSTGGSSGIGGGGGGGGGFGPGMAGLSTSSFNRLWDARNLDFQRRVNR